MQRIIPALACAIVLIPGISRAVDKDTDRLRPDKETAAKLLKVGDKVEIPAGDGGKIETKVVIGKNEYPVTIHVGEKGKAVWSLEEVKGPDDKKAPHLVLRFDRPDGDNPSVAFGKLAPKMKQLCVLLNEKVDTVGTVYAGNQKGDDVENAPIDNRFSSLGNYGSIKVAGPMAYVTPEYSQGGKDAEGTAVVMVARTGTKTKTKPIDVGIVWGLSQFEQLPKK